MVQRIMKNYAHSRCKNNFFKLKSSTCDLDIRIEALTNLG